MCLEGMAFCQGHKADRVTRKGEPGGVEIADTAIIHITATTGGNITNVKPPSWFFPNAGIILFKDTNRVRCAIPGIDIIQPHLHTISVGMFVASYHDLQRVGCIGEPAIGNAGGALTLETLLFRVIQVHHTLADIIDEYFGQAAIASL